jgi:hypothetical protein
MINWDKKHPELVKYAKDKINFAKLKFEAVDVVAYAYEKVRLKEFKTPEEAIKYCKGLIKNALLQERSEFRAENASLKIKEINDGDFVDEVEDRTLPDINVALIKARLSHYERLLFFYYFQQKMSATEIANSLPSKIPERTIRHNIQELKVKVKDICKRLYNL